MNDGDTTTWPKFNFALLSFSDANLNDGLLVGVAREPKDFVVVPLLRLLQQLFHSLDVLLHLQHYVLKWQSGTTPLNHTVL